MGGGGYPLPRSRQGAGYYLPRWRGRYYLPRQGGTTSRQGGTTSQVGVPPSQAGGYPLPEQHSMYLLHGGQYASCIHAGGLSCLMKYTEFSKHWKY